MTNTARKLTNSTDFDSVLKQFGLIVDRRHQSNFWNVVKCFDNHDGKWKMLAYVQETEQADFQFIMDDIKDQPAPPKV